MGTLLPTLAKHRHQHTIQTITNVTNHKNQMNHFLNLRNYTAIKATLESWSSTFRSGHIGVCFQVPTSEFWSEWSRSRSFIAPKFRIYCSQWLMPSSDERGHIAAGDHLAANCRTRDQPISLTARVSVTHCTPLRTGLANDWYDVRDFHVTYFTNLFITWFRW
jgi:hypothetical protein